MKVLNLTSAAIVSGLALFIGACSSGGGGGGNNPTVTGQVGQLLIKPSGGAFYVDEHQGGKTTRLKLDEIVWGRLVDIYDLDQNGEPEAAPVFRDFVINENTQSDGSNYLLETNAITEATRLVVLRDHDDKVNGGAESFAALVAAAARALPPISPKFDDGRSSAPFSFMARNACLVLRFSDALDDSPDGVKGLPQAIEVLTGYSPTFPFTPRVLFDPNHGAIIGGQFHSTRVLIDMNVSEAESALSATAIPVNSLGLPASLTSTSAPNVSVRLATQESPLDGRFRILRAHSGAPLDAKKNGPIDKSVRTSDLVRAFRAGNAQDGNNGFLLDLNAPEIVGSWNVNVDEVRVDSAGLAGFDFIADVTFTTQCAAALRPADILSIGDRFLEVTEFSSEPTVNGFVPGVKLRALVTDPILNTSELFGTAFFLSTLDPLSNVLDACWISFAPQPGIVPNAEVSTSARAVLRFSEPMSPTSVTPFETFMMLRGDSSLGTIVAEDVVVGTTSGANNLKSFVFTPLIPLAHLQGFAELFHVRVGDVTDLAGNVLKNKLRPVNFTMTPDDGDERNASVALRFSDLDELSPVDPTPTGGMDDVRGQVFYDFERGVIKPREVNFSSFGADRTNPIPAIMIPFPSGIQTPLSALGSKLITVWRYCDLGWTVTDETKYNMDVVGLNWAPIGGLVIRDFFDRFEIRLAHSRLLPDEAIDGNLLPAHRSSGIASAPSTFASNILNDPLSPQKVVHDKTLGYVVNPADLFVSTNDVKLMPYPLNRGGGSKLSSYTWRDTAVLRRGGPGSAGVPMDIETGDPLNVVPGNPGTRYRPGNVRSVGLPLLMEFRCYPSDSGLGLNPLDISLAINSSAIPSFRAFSTGGINRNNNVIKIDPDNEPVPSGGWRSNGRPTLRNADNSFYIGQLDTVIRVSRAHTVWIDTAYDAPEFLEPVVVPDPGDQPPGTSVVVEFRGASDFDAKALEDPRPRAFDSAAIGPYGYVTDFTLNPPNELNTLYWPDPDSDIWTDDITSIDGAQYFQMRFSFINDIDTRLNAELSAVGVAFLDK